MRGKNREFYSIRNWRKFQHYTDPEKSGRWVKLHTAVLDDYDLYSLSIKDRLVAVLLLAVAARQNNLIPADPIWLRDTLHLEWEDVDMDALIDIGWIIKVNKDPTLESEALESKPLESEESRVDKKKNDKNHSSVITYPCNGDPKTWDLTGEKLGEWELAYPFMDVKAECGKALQWIKDNPAKRKTARGMTRFLGGWISRAQDRGTFATKTKDHPKATKKIRFGDEVKEVPV